MKNILIRSLVALALGGGIFVLVQACTESQGKGSPLPKSADPIPVKVMELRRSDSQPYVVASGRLTTDDETILAFKTGGIVNSVLVDEGDKVVKGQVLATLDLTEINTLVAQAELGMQKADRDLKRARNLYADSVATLEQLQNAETAFDVAKQQLNAASFNRNYSQIKAPASGFVLKKFVNPGQVVGIGDPILRTNGAGDGQWLLKAGVSDKQWSSIHSGDIVEVAIDAFAGEKYNGKVIRKSESADAATGAFAVEIAVKPKGSIKLASGMFATATIAVSGKTTSWSIPYEAVLDANDNEGFVFVTEDNQVAQKRAVVIESFDGSTIQVARGLEGARALIVSGSAYLTDQSPITIIK